MFSAAGSIREKYNTDIAEDLRQKIRAEVDGVEWVKVDRPKSVSSHASVTSSSTVPTIPSVSKEANDKYFAKLGSINSQRPDDLPPSQGGRYQGFGSSNSVNPNSSARNNGGSFLDQLSSNPVSALSHGWNMFSRSVSQQIQDVNKSYIQPGITKVQDPETRKDYMNAINNFSSNVQEGAKQSFTQLKSFLDENVYSENPQNTRGTYDAEIDSPYSALAASPPPEDYSKKNFDKHD